MGRASRFAVLALAGFAVGAPALAQGSDPSTGKAATGKFPAAAMKRAGLEKKMRGLLADAGWVEVKRLAIVDKTWWIDRVAGADSPIESRHLDAAAAACDKDGCFYRVCTFHQWAVAGGGFGELELTSEGSRKPIPKSETEPRP